MSLKEKFDRFLDYFTEDGENFSDEVVTSSSERSLSTVPPRKELPQQTQVSSESETKEKNIRRLHARQKDLQMKSNRRTEKITIDVSFLRRTEEPTDIFDWLAGIESISTASKKLPEVQARGG